MAGPTRISSNTDNVRRRRRTYANIIRSSIPFYDEMVSMISEGRSRPSIPEYQTIADHVRQALDEVYYGIKVPKQALDDAAAKSAKALGWL
ncbi:MAG TPA: hypothetical protein VD694_03570 [Nitrososphaeraceae archaeon]|nr:hypothetical protein [Nitrososphaeraceae archaeon]